MNADENENENENEVEKVNEIAEYKDSDNANNANDMNDTDKTGNVNNKNNKSDKKINLPNKLTIFRIILVPVYMVFILFPIFNGADVWSKIIAAALFLIASITDFFDGIIARRFNLITDFGKLMDPIADKFMVIGAMIAITASDSFADIRFLMVWVTTIVFFREFAVTSMRLVANSYDGNVIAANITGKLKTILQIVCVSTILLEDIVLTKNLSTPPYLFSYITMAITVIMTVYSGFVYFKTYWSYIDPTK